MLVETDALWSRLQDFALDEAGASLPYSRKLAREQGWSAGFTRRVITEYRRFLYLGAAAGHPVSPSDVIDQAWHLHLTYTKSYWEGLCKGVLGRPFHHVPSQGSVEEKARYADWYARTLESYERCFGARPPTDIWPAPGTVSTGATSRRGATHRWVDLRRNWVIARPRHLRWVGGLLAAGAGAWLIGGCAAVVNDESIFDMRGPEFLRFYAGLAVSFVVGAGALRWWMRGPGGYGTMPVDDPYVVAWLSGGPRRAVVTALASLESRKLITGEKAVISRIPDREPTEELHPFEAGILHAMDGGARTFADLVEEGEAIGDAITAELTGDGLVLTEQRQEASRWRPIWLALIAPAIGIGKIAVGITRDRPVAFLVIMVILTLIAVAAILGRRTWRTRRGDRVMKRLVDRYARDRKNLAVDDPAMVAMSVGVFGAAVLEGTVLASTYWWAKQHGGDGVGSFGGCGSSCSGGDGGGDGCGGGCGGCGGD